MGQATFIIVGCEVPSSWAWEDSDFPEGVTEWVYNLENYLEEPPTYLCGKFRTYSGRNIQGRFVTFKSTYEAKPAITGFIVRVLDKYGTYELEDWDEVPPLKEEWKRLQARAVGEGKTLPDCAAYIVVDHY